MQYRKGENVELDRDYEQSAPFGRVRVGDRFLYWKKMLRTEYIPADEAVRIYRRVEEVKGRTGCCSNDFSVHRLMVERKDGTTLEILIGESLYRGEPERLMEELQKRHPEIRYGKPE